MDGLFKQAAARYANSMIDYRLLCSLKPLAPVLFIYFLFILYNHYTFI